MPSVKPWWRKHPLFVVDDEGYAVSHPSLTPAYRCFWEPHRLSSWAYELVRQLNGTDVAIDPEDREVIATMPSFHKLRGGDRSVLRWALKDTILRPLAIIRPRAELQTGYTDPLPPWSFDQNAGADRILKFVKEWLDWQLEREQRVVESRHPAGKARHRSRNGSQTQKLGNWLHVEALVSPASQNPTQLERRKRAIRHAKEFLKPMVAAWSAHSHNSEARLSPGLPCGFVAGVTDESFPLVVVARVLREARLSARRANPSPGTGPSS